MSFEDTGESSREPGRPQKPLDPEDGPLSVLAQALRDLREDCGNPPYRTLERYAGIPHQRLSEAARADQIPAWPVIDGYIHGCWTFYQHKHKSQPPLEGTGDLARWQQLYRNAGGTPITVPGENEHPSTDENPELALAAEGAAAGREAAPAACRPTRIRLSAGSRLNRRQRTVAAGIACAGLLAGGVLLGVSAGAGRPSTTASDPAVHDAAPAPGTGIFVAAPAPACGFAASGGFRSPATTAFRNIETVYTVSLDGLSASVMEGTYDGIKYDWVESHPTGSRAGMQLRWSDARNAWYYCTATLETGNVATLPDLVATVAVPATVGGRRVIYQACIWHQHPYTAQCSPVGI